jgi:FAD/FMN-containing dehydrogenase
VTGLEVVLPPGRLVRLGGGLRKDVAGLDLKRLLIGSEGILGVITAVYLKLLPAPEASRAIVGAYGTVEEGCAALEAVVAGGLVPATLDFIEGPALAAVASRFPGELPSGAAFLVLAEADGVAGEVGREAEEIAEALGETALAVDEKIDPGALWAWRDGVSGAVAAQLGAKVSEDVAVPLGALAALIEATHAIGRDHGLPSCSWGHGGDGNSHASFLLDPADSAARARAEAAVGDLFDTAIELGGSISGEHGVGYAKRDYLRASVGPESVVLQRQIKRLFDPKGLLNPGKAIPTDE